MKKVIKTGNAPKALGPYSQGIIYDNFVFTAGQIGLNPETGKLEEGIKAQSRRVLENLKAVVEAGGSNLNNIVKVTVFLKDINDWGMVNEIYSEYFSEQPPARSAFQVSALPMDALVEVECIAAVK